jgi:16S rRNA (adenine1518-N6/adenine1519-N6)-dimethyltransferase
VEYLFTVDENVFIPPPGKINLRMRRKDFSLPCGEKLFILSLKLLFSNVES